MTGKELVPLDARLSVVEKLFLCSLKKAKKIAKITTRRPLQTTQRTAPDSESIYKKRPQWGFKEVMNNNQTLSSSEDKDICWVDLTALEFDFCHSIHSFSETTFTTPLMRA